MATTGKKQAACTWRKHLQACSKAEKEVGRRVAYLAWLAATARADAAGGRAALR